MSRPALPTASGVAWVCTQCLRRRELIDELALRTPNPVAYRRALPRRNPRARACSPGSPECRLASPRAWRRPRRLAAAGFGSYLAQVVEVRLREQRVWRTPRGLCNALRHRRHPTQFARKCRAASHRDIGRAASEITRRTPRRTTNFGDYRVLRMDEMPSVDVHLVDSSAAPGGIGETATRAHAGGDNAILQRWANASAGCP